MPGLISEYRDALSVGTKRYFTGKACPYGHIAQRFVSTRTCVACVSERAKKWYMENRERCTIRKRRWYSENLNKQRDTAFRRQYGITLADYEKLNIAQGRVCAICLGPNRNGKRLDVDHCHDTGKVRGLLCAHCNQALGGFKNGPAILRRAVAYLEKCSD